MVNSKIKIPGCLVENYKAVFILYVLLAIVVSLQVLLAGPWEANSRIYTHYNNYIIFKQSFLHLIANQNLYTWHLEEHWDLFKYSPTFALFFGLFAYWPEAIGLSLWNLLNALCLFFAIKQLPRIGTKEKVFILLFLVVELVISLQNSQSNALIAGLIILAFVLLENHRYFLATLCIAATVYIKIFGLLAIVLFLFYPRKQKLFLYIAFWFVLLTLLPLILISLPQLKLLYSSWFDLLVNDHSVEYGISVLGWLTAWFHWTINKNLVVLSGLLIFVIPFLQWKRFSDYFPRLFLLTSILIWIVIFNHMAESPTYIIAMAGVSIWYFSQARTVTNMILVIVAFIFSSLSQTDVFPRSLQDNFIDPYIIKAVPCIIIWVKLIVDSLWDSSKATTHLYFK